MNDHARLDRHLLIHPPGLILRLIAAVTWAVTQTRRVHTHTQPENRT